MKCINVRAALISLFLGFAVTQAHAEDYYIYQTPNGVLIISNKKPPPGSKIIRQHSWPDGSDNDVPQGQKPAKSQPNGQPEGSPQSSKAK